MFSAPGPPGPHFYLKVPISTPFHQNGGEKSLKWWFSPKVEGDSQFYRGTLNSRLKSIRGVAKSEGLFSWNHMGIHKTSMKTRNFKELPWSPSKFIIPVILRDGNWRNRRIHETVWITAPNWCFLSPEPPFSWNSAFSRNSHFSAQKRFARKSIPERETALSRRRGLRECQFRLMF